MKTLYLLLFGFFYWEDLKCQVRGSVYEKNSRKPIAYAMITDKDSSICIFSDSVGTFCIDPKLLKSKSLLCVSAPNYFPQEIQNITHKIEIELNPIHEVSQKVESNEVSIKTKNITKSIGIPLVILFNPVFGGKAYENTEIALQMLNKVRKTGTIQSISIYISSSGIYNAPFRLKIYNFNNLSVPKDELSHEDIILYGTTKDAWNTYDISKYGIIFPKEGCFVSVEWLNIDCTKYHYLLQDGNQGLGISVGLTDSFAGTTSCQRINKKEWQKVGTIFWEGFRLVNYHPMINIKVLF